MAKIVLQSVSKSYRVGKSAVEVLRGIDLEIQSQDCLAVTGASGSGKTTLLNLIGGMDRADAGDILWDGQSWKGKSLGDLSRWRANRLGFVFQAYHLLDELTVLENTALPARLARRDRIQEAEALLDSVGLSHRLDHRPSELSGGEKQRCVIARALINNPDVVLADEPTGNLDRENSDSILKLLLDLTSERQKSLVLVTHDPIIAAAAKRRVHLVDGKISES
ncbi:MAG: ABC transporter ATP-binding protein [Verrucomicrobiota bacterium]